MSSGTEYRRRDPSLPRIGWGRPWPKEIAAADVEAIGKCEDPLALGLMRGALDAFWGAAGGIAIGIATGTSLALFGLTWFAAAAFAGTAVAALQTIETRRRARHWAAVIDARLATMSRSLSD